jgi:hypothetical protein
LAAQSGLPVLELDDFYRNGDDPALPRNPVLGIVDWDDPRAWDAAGALDAIEAICRTGAAEVPVYDMSRDGRWRQALRLGAHARFRGHRDLRRRDRRRPARNADCWRTAIVVRPCAVEELPPPAAPRPDRSTASRF